MGRAAALSTFGDSPAVHVSVVGPESPVPGAADLRRLFSHRLLTRGRRERLARAAKVIATRGARIIGLASFEREGDEVRVHELAFDGSQGIATQDILRPLVDALELACLASGARRLVLLPQAIGAVGPFERLGYHFVNGGCAGAWFEKTFT